MKVWICLVVASVCLSVAFGEESCVNLSEGLETACGCPLKLTVISSPRKNQVDENNCDAEYEKREWQEQPTVIFTDANPNKNYTLLLVDPDAMSHEKGQFYLHWLVTNIKGEDFRNGDLYKAKYLQAFYGPEPSKGTGIHRYMFIVFEHKCDNNQEMKEVESPTKRSKFELAPWLESQRNLCGPVAGIQFRTQY